MTDLLILIAYGSATIFFMDRWAARHVAVMQHHSKTAPPPCRATGRKPMKGPST